MKTLFALVVCLLPAASYSAAPTTEAGAKKANEMGYPYVIPLAALGSGGTSAIQGLNSPTQAVGITATASGSNSDMALITTPPDFQFTTGAITTTVGCYSVVPFKLNGKSVTVSVVTAGAYGSTLYLLGSNAAARPSTVPSATYTTAWKNLSAPRWVIQQPLGGLDGSWDSNIQYVSGVRWLWIMFEADPKSSTTVNVQGVQ